MKFYYDASGRITEEYAGVFYGERITAENVWGVNGLLRRITYDYDEDFYSTTETEYPIAGYRGDILSNFDGYRCLYDAYGNERYDKVSDNPFGYCGEYTDEETGFIYLRGRYYNPNAGRFISEDTHWNVDNMIYGDKEYKDGETKIPDINAIIQSTNLYAYCMNNPMKYIDTNGWDAGDWFMSEESAAKDFSNIYNPISIKNNAEYGAYIYSFTGIKEVDGKALITTYYTYGIPIKGNQKSVEPEKFKDVDLDNAIVVAIIHTHGRYNEKYDDERFSPNDIGALQDSGLKRMYLATPGGYLKVLHAKNFTAERIAQIPFDFKSPDKAWWRIWGGVHY